MWHHATHAVLPWFDTRIHTNFATEFPIAASHRHKNALNTRNEITYKIWDPRSCDLYGSSWVHRPVSVWWAQNCEHVQEDCLEDANLDIPYLFRWCRSTRSWRFISIESGISYCCLPSIRIRILSYITTVTTACSTTYCADFKSFLGFRLTFNCWRACRVCLHFAVGSRL